MTRHTEHPLDALTPHLPPKVKFPPAVVDALKAAALAKGRAHLASRMVGIVSEEAAAWDQAERRADIENALKGGGPADFVPYRVTNPRPDVEGVIATRKVFHEAKGIAQSDLGNAIAGASKALTGICKAVWLDASGPVSDDLTVREAALIEAEREVAKSAVLGVILTLAAAASGTPAELKAIRKAAKAGTLVPIAAMRDHLAGGPHRRAEERRIAESNARKEAENRKSAAEAAAARRNRLGADEETTTESTEEGEES